jgi:lipoyl(octanoyl) transferase
VNSSLGQNARVAPVPAYVYDLLGTPLRYDEADAMQRNLAAARSQGAIPDTVLLCEHPPTLTLGRSSEDDELPLGRAGYEALGWDVCDTDRGGRSTWHGPGQLVGYPILDLRDHGKDLRQYSHDLEQVIVLALGDMGVEATTREGAEWVGVYAAGGKIASIGIRAEGWIVRHGFALNVDCDLSAFGRFDACGLDVPFTSVAEELGRPSTIADVREPVLRRMSEVLELELGLLPVRAVA